MKKIFFSVLAVAMLSLSGIQAQFTQQPLPYAFDALEPFVDARTMDIHFNRHHKGYVNNLNKAVEGTPLAEMKLEDILSRVSAYSTSVRNNGGGHYNHDLFWRILGPEKDSRPSEALASAINASFGSMDAMKEQLNQAAATRFGSGWAWLFLNADGKLAICSTPNQDNPLMDVCECRGTPILGIDVWEHAYYLHYQNKRGDYLNAIWNVINWNEVSTLYHTAAQGKR